MSITYCRPACYPAEARNPGNHLGVATVFATDPVKPMTIRKLLGKAEMPHNKALPAEAAKPHRSARRYGKRNIELNYLS